MEVVVRVLERVNLRRFGIEEQCHFCTYFPLSEVTMGKGRSHTSGNHVEFDEVRCHILLQESRSVSASLEGCIV